jgi:hypothetical protein
MSSNPLSSISRRRVLACGAAALAAPCLTPAADLKKTKVWVQLTTGGHPYRTTFQEMFLDPMFIECEIWPVDHPDVFSNVVNTGYASGVTAAPPRGRGAVGGGATERDEAPDYAWEPSGGRPHPGYDVLVLNDQLEWPEAARQNARKAVDAGRGVVLIHNSLGDNQSWPFWYQEVTGGHLVLNDHDGMKKSTVTPSGRLELRPVGKHVILRDIESFTLAKEECYRGMWQSPGITPLLQTASGASDKTVAWIGLHRTARVVCIQPGGTSETHRNREYRKLVRNAILWAGRHVG